MISTILTSAVVYIATGIDYMIILIILFSQVKKGDARHIWWGQYLGTAVIIILCIIASLGVIAVVPDQWILGLLGLIPIYFGIKFIISGEEDADESKILSIFSSNRFNYLFLTVAFIVLSSSADDFSIYIPYFVTLSAGELIVTVVVFFIMVGVLCLISQKFAAIPMIEEKIERHEQWIVPVVFIGLGLFILYENGTFRFLIDSLL